MATTTAMESGSPKAQSGPKILESGASCLVCAASDITRTLLNHESGYGKGDAHAVIDTQLPVSECHACGFTFLDHEAEQVKQDALCRHFGVLRPDKIKGATNLGKHNGTDTINAGASMECFQSRIHLQEVRCGSWMMPLPWSRCFQWQGRSRHSLMPTD